MLRNTEQKRRPPRASWAVGAVLTVRVITGVGFFSPGNRQLPEPTGSWFVSRFVSGDQTMNG